MQTSAWFGLATLSKGHRLNTGRQGKTMTKNIGKHFERLNKVRIFPYAKSARHFFRLNYWTIENKSVSLCWNDYWSQMLLQMFFMYCSSHPCSWQTKKLGNFDNIYFCPSPRKHLWKCLHCPCGIHPVQQRFGLPLCRTCCLISPCYLLKFCLGGVWQLC